MKESSHQVSLPSWSASQLCWSHRRLYLIAAITCLVVAGLITACIPTLYASEVKISDEFHEEGFLYDLDNEWADFGLENVNRGLKDPSIYSLVLSTTTFADKFLQTQLPDKNLNYADYLSLSPQLPWWEVLYHNILHCTQRELLQDLVEQRVNFKYSEKYSTLTLQVLDRNPVVAAVLADSLRVLLEQYIADATKRSALTAEKNAESQKDSSRHALILAKQHYADYCDTHQEALLPSEKEHIQYLEKEIQLAGDAYEKYCYRLYRAKALVGKMTPAFYTYQTATVPISPVSPNYFSYALAFLFLSWIFLTWWILYRYNPQKNK